MAFCFKSYFFFDPWHTGIGKIQHFIAEIVPEYQEKLIGNKIVRILNDLHSLFTNNNSVYKLNLIIVKLGKPILPTHIEHSLEIIKNILKKRDIILEQISIADFLDFFLSIWFQEELLGNEMIVFVLI